YCYGGTEFTRDVLLDRIEIENNGLLFKKYEMNYMRDVYSQLQKVTQYSSQGSALNPAAVAWTAQTNQFTQTTNYSSTTDEYYFVGDFNGDGRDDLVTTPVKTSYTSSDKWKLYLADASGTMVYHTEGNLNSSFEYFLVNDFNGDGLTDLMMQEKHPDSTYPNKKHYYFYQSDGNTFTRSTSYYLCYNNERLDVVDYNGDGVLEFMFHNTSDNWYLYTYSGASIYSASIPSFGKYYIVDTGMQNRILDFNGDGCSDLLTLFDDGYKVYEFKGNNNILVETYSGTNIDNSDFILFGDYNGDGRIDILKNDIYSSNPGWYMLSLTSNGFQSRQLSCFDNFSIEYINNRIYARDMNADGRTDVVLVGRGDDVYNPYNRINVAISSGNDFALTEYVSSTTMVIGYAAADRFYNFGDYNGDGRYQLFYKYVSTSKLFSFANGTPSHLAGTLFDGLGAKTSLTYLPMSNSNVYTRGTGAVYPLMDFSSAIQLVSQVTSDNGIGGTTAVGYQYAGAKAHQQGKGFLGFSQVTATNAATGISTENRYSFDETYYYQQLRAVYARLGNDTISTIRNTWNENSFGNKRIFPYIATNTQTDKLAGLTVQTSVSSYDSYGNPASVVRDLGGGHTRTTSYVYNDERADSWLIGRPTTITETSVKGSDTRTFVIDRSYFSWKNSPDTDRYNQGDAAAWQLAREYDAFGNLWKEHQSATGLYIRSTIYTYDSNGVNLLSITDPAGRETAYTYVPATGLISTQTDPFGNLTTYNYNSADQPGSIVPDGGITVTYTRSLDVTGGPANARYSVQETGSDGSQVKTWYDKLEREIRKETKSFSGTMVKVDRQYNLKGQLAQVSEPTTGTPSNWNMIGYDGYGRVTSQDPYFVATTSFSYSGATTTRTVNSRTYTSTIDATGLVTGRTDPGGSMTY
ncbi:MAG: FG-GAP-like repeat-containing protein, partial [Desulfotomaculaceae bacterium]